MYKEKFLPIKNYEGLYEISNAGRVKSLERKTKNHPKNYTIKEKILKSNLIGPGKKKYFAVSLFKNGKGKTHKIHQLLANAFILNPDPEHLTDIDHIRNGDTSCNFQTSLEWVTRSENVKRGFRRDGRKHRSIMNAVIQNDLNGNFIAEFESMREAERQTGISQGNISQCCKGNKNYSHAGGFKWKYKNTIGDTNE